MSSRDDELLRAVARVTAAYVGMAEVPPEEIGGVIGEVARSFRSLAANGGTREAGAADPGAAVVCARAGAEINRAAAPASRKWVFMTGFPLGRPSLPLPTSPAGGSSLISNGTRGAPFGVSARTGAEPNQRRGPHA